MPDIEAARAALYAQRPEELLGLIECGWLDVKSSPYRLDDAASVEELAKDVAAFANAKTGGLLLVGFGVRKEHDTEVIDRVRPMPRDLVDLDRHRKLIRERVIPAPRDMRVEWVDCEGDKGILVIDIPAQPAARLPHVVPGPSRATEPSRFSVAVPIREADATAWLPQREIQRLLSAGWKETGGPSDEFVSGLIKKAVTAAQRQPQVADQEIGIGEGEPGWKGLFHQAWNELMDRRMYIGRPGSAVYWDGPGVVQHFEGPQFLFGWVLCALPHRRPVAIDGEVWKELPRAAAGSPEGDPLRAIGYPAPGVQDTRVIDGSAMAIELEGGSWGHGKLVRDSGSGEWRWEPAIGFSLGMSRAATTWTGGTDPRMLRLRAVATLPWAGAGELGIKPERRRALEGQLPACALADSAVTLSRHRGADLRAAEWNRGPHLNSSDWLSYSSVIGTADGQKAIEAEVMIALPNSVDSSVVTCAEIRVFDLDGWKETASDPQAPLRQNLRLSPEDVGEFFITAWRTATEILPQAVTDDPGQLNWAYPPTVDLRLVAENGFDSPTSSMPVLDDYINLSQLGTSDRGPLRQMCVTVTAPLVLSPDTRRDQARRALAYMSERWGFLEGVDWLLRTG